MARDGRGFLLTLVKRQNMLHDILRGDALSKGSSMGGVHRMLAKLFGFHELLRILPDLSSVSPK